MPLRYSSLPVLTAAFALFLGSSNVTGAATFTVNLTADLADFSVGDGVCDTDDSLGDGPCTLRAAIQQANTVPGFDIIRFSIPGTGPHVISPAGTLDAIGDPVYIDGTSEPDYTAAPTVVVDGTGAGVGSTGLHIVATGGGTTINGLAVVNFDHDSGNPSAGILIESSGNTIARNYVGIDPDGTTEEGIANGVVVDGASDNDIGPDNVISGNEVGVVIAGSGSSGNDVFGNRIGATAAGDAAVPNIIGVWITSPSNTVGPGNVISGNIEDGVAIALEDADGNTVKQNIIGMTADGVTALGNGWSGVDVYLGAEGNVIGAPAQGNLISGNSWGVAIQNASGNEVAGNIIGPDVTGAAGPGNVDGGVLINNSPNNTIGPTNLVSANGDDGVRIQAREATGNTVSNNQIGVGLDGSTGGVGNAGDGVGITFAASGNTVGPGNVIADNGENGVAVDSEDISPPAPGTVGNTITANSIHSNTGKGIENVSGGNTELTPPTITAAGSVAGTSTCLDCTVDVYSDDDDEGRTYHGSTPTNGVTGDWSFVGAILGPNVTATVTDGSGNTSEFSGACAFFLDDDCDGFTTSDENFITTDPNDDCPDNTSDDAWPPDFNNDTDVDIIDVNILKPAFFSSPPGPPYTPRVDLNTDSTVDIFDINIFKPFFFVSCTP